MSWQHRIYHLPLRILFRLSSMCFVPKWLLEFGNKPQACVAYQFGAAHHLPRRTKGKKSRSIRRPEPSNPRYGVAVEQIVSAQLFLIPNISGFLTSQSFWGCTPFMYHVSNYFYVHIMRDLSLSETLLAKEALENLMSQAGQTVKHNQCDNGRFSDNGFIDVINQKDQNINICGVGSHQHNGIVKNKIKILTNSARTLLLCGIIMCPQIIDKIFWPFALKAITKRLNILQIYHK